MLKFLLIIFILLLINLPKELCAKTEVDLDFTMGYRKDFFQWNIAGNYNGNYVNVLSELTWRNMIAIEGKFKSRFLIDDRIYIRAIFAYGRYIIGENQDSDYEGSNRTQEFSRSDNRADIGKTIDFSIGAGYRFYNDNKTLKITPLGGLAFYYMDFHMKDGVQTVNTVSGTLGSFNGLDSRYEAHWFSAFAGMELEYLINSKLSLKFGAEYHLSYFYGAANWNLRTDFQHPTSFEHTASFNSGVNLELGVKYALSESWSFITDFMMRYWQSRSGVDKTYFSSGQTSRSKLNEVYWFSYSLHLGISYGF